MVKLRVCVFTAAAVQPDQVSKSHRKKQPIETAVFCLFCFGGEVFLEKAVQVFSHKKLLLMSKPGAGFKSLQFYSSVELSAQTLVLRLKNNCDDNVDL